MAHKYLNKHFLVGSQQIINPLSIIEKVFWKWLWLILFRILHNYTDNIYQVYNGPEGHLKTNKRLEGCEHREKNYPLEFLSHIYTMTGYFKTTEMAIISAKTIHCSLLLYSWRHLIFLALVIKEPVSKSRNSDNAKAHTTE